MNRRLLALAAVLALLTLPAGAQAAGTWAIVLNGGMSLPMGDFADEDLFDAQSGMQFGGAVEYGINSKFAVGAEGNWNQNKHGAEGETFDIGDGVTITAEKDKFNTIQFGAYGKYLIPTSGKITPHVKLGLGFYDLKEDYEWVTSTGEVFTDESEDFEQPGSRFGGKLGLGALYKVSPKFGLGLEGEYNYASMDKDKFEVSSVQFIGLHALVSYSFGGQ